MLIRAVTFAVPYVLPFAAFIAPEVGADLTTMQGVVHGGIFGLGFGLVTSTKAGKQFSAGLVGEKVIDNPSRGVPILNGAIGAISTLIIGYQAGLTSGVGLAGATLAAAAVGTGLGLGIRRGQAKRTDIVRRPDGQCVQQIIWGTVHKVGDPDAAPYPDQSLREDPEEVPAIRRARASAVVIATPEAAPAPQAEKVLGPAVRNEDVPNLANSDWKTPGL